MTSNNACSVCAKPSSSQTNIQRCSRCQGRYYCGVQCQTVDWKTHKRTCGVTVKWYDGVRKCQDGSTHEGNLELITWSNEKEETGWGHCLEEESDSMREKFEKEFGGDEQKLYDYWPQAFRWTCCGTDAGMDWGCDHHGTGSKPCSCDFCKMGKPLPDRIYLEDNASRHGLTLRRGPDRRSFNLAGAAIAAAGRNMFNLGL